MIPLVALRFALILTVLTNLISLISTIPLHPSSTAALSTAQLNQYLPGNLQIHSNFTTQPPTITNSTCIRSLWQSQWTISLWLRNKTTPELGPLGSGFYDNANADCDGIVWPRNPTVLSQDPKTGRVTGYSVTILVDRGEGYDGCVESAVWQAERQRVKCKVVASPCGEEASECAFWDGGK